MRADAILSSARAPEREASRLATSAATTCATVFITGVWLAAGASPPFRSLPPAAPPASKNACTASTSGTTSAPNCLSPLPTIISCLTNGLCATKSSSSCGSTFSPLLSTMVSFIRPTSTTLPAMLEPLTPAGATHPRSPESNHPSPSMARAVAPASSRYPDMTHGPRTSSSPCAPSGSASRVSGCTTRTCIPGIGTPTLPRTLPRLSPSPPSSRRALITGEVSVSPHPLETSRPMDS
mmetsp:Transcript_19566/g.48397  ORF Transcript_19566/g.48397 Transcript_19566/m.48397 type:complete len:237 (+) Transcript_19566:3134-3844(+)